MSDYFFERHSLERQRTAFGEQKVALLKPIAQLKATYGIRTSAETDLALGGTATVEDNNFVLKTGTNNGAKAILRSARNCTYRPGESSLFRFTAGFDVTNDVANSRQCAGALNDVSGFVVGMYNGEGFGVMHRTGGRHEIRTLTLSTAAGGAETLSLTLNGTLYSIALTSGTKQHNCYEIVTWMEANQSAWSVEQINDTVIFLHKAVGPATSTYSVSSSGTAAGSIAQNALGVVNTDTWVMQDDFNIDKLDGTGESGFVIDPSKGNVYAISMQYLGYGSVDMKVEDPKTGLFFSFHRFQFANSRVIPTLTNASLKVGWHVESLGSTTDIRVFGASAMAGVEGLLQPFFEPDSRNVEKTVGTTSEALLSLRVRKTFNNFSQLSEVFPKIAYVGTDSAKPVQIQFHINPTFDAASGEPDWNHQNTNNSIVDYDTSAAEMSDPGRTIGGFTVAGASGSQFNFASLAAAAELDPVHLKAGDIFTVSARVTSGASSDVALSITWQED